MEKHLLNLQQVEHLTGITFKTLKKRIQAAGITPTQEKGTATIYDTRVLLPALFQRSSNNVEQLSIERARLAKAQRERIEIEIERLKGKLVEKEEWYKDWYSMLVDFKNNLLSISLKVTPLVVGKSSDEIYNILRGQINGALDELAARTKEKSESI